MSKEIVILLTEDYADWEISFISAELRRSNDKYEIKYVGLTKEPIKSMGGLSVIPDYSIDKYLVVADNFDVKMLLLCGGDGWKAKGYDVPKVNQLVDWAIAKHLPVAAICDATTYLACNSYLNEVEHTGNSMDYMVGLNKGYTGQEYFIQKQCVRNDQFVTANGFAALEFSKDIMKVLEIEFEYFGIDDWYEVNKNGIFPVE